MNKLVCKYLFAILCTGTLVIAGQASGNENEQLRDPTRPLHYSAPATASAPELALQAVFNRQGQRVAIVNGKRVQVGDQVSGARIDSISEHGIVYSWQGQRKALQLRPELF